MRLWQLTWSRCCEMSASPWSAGTEELRLAEIRWLYRCWEFGTEVRFTALGDSSDRQAMGAWTASVMVWRC